MDFQAFFDAHPVPTPTPETWRALTAYIGAIIGTISGQEVVLWLTGVYTALLIYGKVRELFFDKKPRSSDNDDPSAPIPL